MTLKALWEIQELDSHQIQLEKQLQEDLLPQKLREIKSGIIIKQEQIKKIKKDYDGLKLSGKNLEQEIENLYHEINMVSKRLYDNENNNFKELESQSEQLEKLKSQLEIAEEKYLVSLEKKDNLKFKYKNLKDALNASKDEFKSMHETYENNRAEIKKALNSIPDARQELVKAIEVNLWHKYRDLKRRYPDPLSVVKKGVCSGCHIRLSSVTFKKLKKEVVFCSYCGRILCVEDEE